MNTVETITTNDAYEMGYERGMAVASWVDMPETAPESCAEWCGACDTPEAIIYCVMEHEARESESFSRQMTPFEFTAYELNAQEWPDEVWDAFDEGIEAGIQEELSQRINRGI